MYVSSAVTASSLTYPRARRLPTSASVHQRTIRSPNLRMMWKQHSYHILAGTLSLVETRLSIFMRIPTASMRTPSLASSMFVIGPTANDQLGRHFSRLETSVLLIG